MSIKYRKPFLVLLAVVIIVLAFFVAKNIMDYRNYKTAEKLVIAQEYEEALEILDTFKDKDYRDTAELTDLCNTHISYENGDLTAAYYYSSGINAEVLPHECSERFADFKKTITTEYEELLKTQREQEQKALMGKIKNGVPFVGMPEKYIGITALGKPADKVRHNREIKGSYSGWANLYDFYNEEGRIFTARCVDGKVAQVWDDRDSPLKPYIPPKTSSEKEEEDPYDAAEYSDAEDFYYEHYDDFFDYEDAEDYYNEHTE